MRQDYRPGQGPIRGVVFGVLGSLLLVAALLAAGAAVLAVL